MNTKNSRINSVIFKCRFSFLKLYILRCINVMFFFLLAEKVETDYKMTNNYIESLKKHIKQIHKGTKEELEEQINTYDVNLTQKITNKKKVTILTMSFELHI